MARRRLRSALRLVVLLEAAGEGCLHYALRRLRGRLSVAERARWLHQSCARALRRLGIEANILGVFPARGLLVSNHVSYLDILVFSGLAPCVFVAKKEVRRWPIFGPMAVMAGTVFVDRSRAADTRRVNDEMQATLAAGAVVILFAEGTSSDGTAVLFFRPPLFEAAVRTAELMTPAHISYRAADGDVRNDICYWGEARFLPHLLRLLALHDVRATVRFAERGRVYDDRKLAAQATHQVVEDLAGVAVAAGAARH